MPMSRWVWTASLALVLAGRPTDALSQAAAPQIVVTPAGVTDELVLRDGTRAYGRVQRIDDQVPVGVAFAGELKLVSAAIDDGQ